ncbi:ribonuclease J [Cytobacillus sp. IB215316]|uniref:ribonuclease J n=1 Tax=Cytobacillus sp. IB215316 TaxID=3097354 RepID=UPI002A17810B|nr:ribonuclease J [Cytobacillus sp. IB215316]MDX8362196.1 ribonuclease J [Cytobacillus sp. IB215316]
MLNEKKDNIRLIALGGLGESGKNMHVVEIDTDIFVVDAGLKYPEGEMFGVDAVIPDISYLIKNRERVKGIFLTHGHEDHIGAIPYVLKELRVPIYGTKLTLALVGQLLKQHGLTADDLLNEVTATSILTVNQVKVSFFRTTHSIPDCVGICFHTAEGAIVHTGDFKFDQTPVGMETADIDKMASIGKEGVLFLLSDSSNADKPGYSVSESVIGQEISEGIYSAPNRVVVATFASNINRIQQVFDAAEENNRKVAIVGRHIYDIVMLSIDLGYLKVSDDIITPLNQIEKLPDHQVLILTCGTKGEPMAALSKMATQSNKPVHIQSKDTVLIASPVIPGSELIVSKTIDHLLRIGANVVYNKNLTDISSHGSQEELKLMLNMMKPTYFIPTHGEYRMQSAHAKLALSVGVKSENVLIVDNGDVVEFNNGKVSTGEKVPAANILIDGLGVGDVGHIVLRDRKLLSKDGILIVVVTLDKVKKQIASGPEIITRGFVYVRESESLIEQACEIVNKIIAQCVKGYIIEWNSIKISIRDALNEFLFQQTKRRPMILPIIMEV